MSNELPRAPKGAVPHRRPTQPQSHSKPIPTRSGSVRKRTSAAVIRRRRTRIFVVLSALLLIECGAALLTSPVFAVNEVQVIGVGSLPAEEANAVIGTATLSPGCNWFRVPRARIVAQIRHMPWVRTFNVERLFPNRLRVRITPREPVAVVQSGGVNTEVDADGFPIRAARSQAAHSLPHVILPADAHLDYGRPIQDVGVIAALNLLHRPVAGMPVRIAKIEVDQSDNLCLNMDDNTPIQLGQAEELDEKMAVVRRIYERQPDVARSLAAINLSCPAKPACTLRPVPSSRPDTASDQAAGN